MITILTMEKSRCTVLKLDHALLPVRTEDKDGYDAVQLGFDDKTEKSANKAEIGHSKRFGTSVKKKVIEFKVLIRVQIRRCDYS